MFRRLKEKPYYEKVFSEVEAPSGMLAKRRRYSATTKFVG